MNKAGLLFLVCGLVFMRATLAAPGDAIEVFHQYSGDNIHCFTIVEYAGQPLAELKLGASWNGHPLPESVSLEVKSTPGGWDASVVKMSRYNYQYLLISTGNAYQAAKPADGSRSNLICIKTAMAASILETLPFAFTLAGSNSAITGQVQPATARSGKDLNKIYDQLKKQFDEVN